jgi:hypothetical protein
VIKKILLLLCSVVVLSATKCRQAPPPTPVYAKDQVGYLATRHQAGAFWVDYPDAIAMAPLPYLGRWVLPTAKFSSRPDGMKCPTFIIYNGQEAKAQRFIRPSVPSDISCAVPRTESKLPEDSLSITEDISSPAQ